MVSVPPPPAPGEHTVRDGIRVALPLLPPLLLIGISFGLATRSLGWDWLPAVAMSAVVYSGSAQFAAAGVLAAGGAAGAAVAAGTLANLRYVPFGLLAAPATRGSALRRAAEGQLVVDASVVIASRDGGMSRGLLLGSSIPQYVGWVGGTAIGAAAGVGADIHAWGVDAVFPAFFLALLATELRRPKSRQIAAVAALLALALTPFVPPGVPVVAATLAALVGMRQ